MIAISRAKTYVSALVIRAMITPSMTEKVWTVFKMLNLRAPYDAPATDMTPVAMEIRGMIANKPPRQPTESARPAWIRPEVFVRAFRKAAPASLQGIPSNA